MCGTIDRVMKSDDLPLAIVVEVHNQGLGKLDWSHYRAGYVTSWLETWSLERWKCRNSHQCGGSSCGRGSCGVAISHCVEIRQLTDLPRFPEKRRVSGSVIG